MDLVFLELINKILPFYLLIVIGFVFGKFAKIDKSTMVKLLFYVAVPAVFFEFGTKIELNPTFALLPILFFGISCFLNLVYYHLCKYFFESKAKINVIAFSAGTGNTGYFGLPVAIMLFDQETVAVYMLMNIGLSFYDYTLGAFTIARSQFSKKQAFIQVAKLPILYAFILGMGFAYYKISIPEHFEVVFYYFRGVYAIVGMMILGVILSEVTELKLDIKFIIAMFSARFIVAPLITLLIIYIDEKYFMLYSQDVHLAMLLISIVPLAANTVIFASAHKSHPQEAALAVTLSMLIGIFYLPWVVSIFF